MIDDIVSKYKGVKEAMWICGSGEEAEFDFGRKEMEADFDVRSGDVVW